MRPCCSCCTAPAAPGSGRPPERSGRARAPGRVCRGLPGRIPARVERPPPRARPGPARGIDDVAFLQALVEHLRPRGAVYAIGMSNGGFLAEHVAGHGLLDLAGVVLVASSATTASRQDRPEPAPLRPLRFLAFHGTADPLVAYGGGPIGPLGRLSGGRPSRAGRGVTAPIERVATDWAAGPAAPPRRDALPGAAGDCAVERLTWPGPDGPAIGRDALPDRRRGPHLARRGPVPPCPHRGPGGHGTRRHRDRARLRERVGRVGIVNDTPLPVVFVGHGNPMNALGAQPLHRGVGRTWARRSRGRGPSCASRPTGTPTPLR